jgi:HK97 family phage major capsid protein
LRRVFAAEASFALDRAILSGTGAGQPLGIVGAPGTIVVPKATGQASGTIVSDNIEALWARLAGPCRKRSVWILSEDAETQIAQNVGGTVSPSTVSMYAPAGTAGNQNDHALIKGRPVIVAEQAARLGTPGDIVLADLSQYVLLDGGLKTDLSVDADFVHDQCVFRFSYRCDGRPIWATPILPFNGSAITRSAYVALAQR